MTDTDRDPYERPEYMPPPDHPLLAAARLTDWIADHQSLDAALRLVGVSQDALMFVAGQRALRARLFETGRADVIATANRESKYVRIDLTDEDKAAITLYQAIACDALLIGLAAAQELGS